MTIRILGNKPDLYDWHRLIDNLIEILIIIGSMIKLLQFIRYKEEYAYFV